MSARLAQSMDKKDKEAASFIQFRIRKDLKEELKTTAELAGVSISALLHMLIKGAISDARRRHPEAFPDYAPPPVIVGEPEMDQLLFEAFEGKEMTPEMKKSIAEAVKAILKVQEVSS